MNNFNEFFGSDYRSNRFCFLVGDLFSLIAFEQFFVFAAS